MSRLTTTALALALLAVVVTGCGLVRPRAVPVVDGWRVGPIAECSAGDRCPELLAAAAAGLDRRVPDHAAIAAATLHMEGALVDPETGDLVLSTRSGGATYVARFELVDGTVRAIGVGFPGISREPVVFDGAP